MIWSYASVILEDSVTFCFFFGGCEVVATGTCFLFACPVTLHVVGLGDEAACDCVGFADVVESVPGVFFLVAEWGPDS